MNKSVVVVGAWLVLLWQGAGNASSFSLTPADLPACAIQVLEKPGHIVRFAAEELQKHLKLILGRELPMVEAGGPGKRFCVGLRPPADTVPLGAEESRYVIEPDRVYLYGEDHLAQQGATPYLSVVQPGSLDRNRVGTLFAVYSFLENELGVRWLEPGDDGIACEPRSALEIPARRFTWQSPLQFQRGIRTYLWSWDRLPGQDQVVPEALRLSREQIEVRRYEDNLWLRRMRMGNRGQYLSFGHAFTQWWDKYGSSHPEYFALNGKGQRQPLSPDRPDRIKMCVSSEALHERIVREWLDRQGRDHSSVLNVCENDGGGGGLDEFCHCDRCRALDALREGEPFGANLTDRYVYFYNACLAAARRHDPGAIVCAYAYSSYLQPPRETRLADGVVIEFISGMAAEPADTARLFEGWREKGMQRMLFRPNDLCVEIGLPMGHERRIFEHQQLAFRYGALGTDHDSLHGFWTGVSGLTYYIVAKSQTDPAQPFEHWEDEYAAAFGAAREEVKEYFRYWREEVLEKRLLPAHRRSVAQTGHGLLGWGRVRGYLQAIGNYYDARDFDRTDEILHRAQARNLTARQAQRVEQLLLANQHDRLTFEAMAAVSSPDVVGSLEKARQLVQFRIRHQNDLHINWPLLFIHQNQFGGLNFWERCQTWQTLTGGTGQLDLGQRHNLVKNGSFEDGLAGWNVSLWREGSGGQTYEGEDVRVIDAASPAHDRCLQVTISQPGFDGVYGVAQTVAVTPGKPYILRYAWKRRLAGAGSATSLTAPRLRLTFSNAKGKAVLFQDRKALWYDASNQTDLVTDWTLEARVLRIDAGSPIRRITLTFHFASEGENCLKNVELLE